MRIALDRAYYASKALDNCDWIRAREEHLADATTTKVAASYSYNKREISLKI